MSPNRLPNAPHARHPHWSRPVVVALIGPNGAGKSTLMNAIGGFVPAGGAVHVLGRDVSGLPAYRRHRAGRDQGYPAGAGD